MVGENQCEKIVNPSLSDMWSANISGVITVTIKEAGRFYFFNLGGIAGVTLVPNVYLGTGVFCLPIKKVKFYR